jgi:hypothetical protein
MNNEIETPKLIETGTHMYLKDVLKNCHMTRVNVYYYVLNFGVLFLFVGIAVLVLYYCNQQRMSDYEKKQKMIRDQQYVLSKIRFYQENAEQRKQAVSSISQLPML